nr:beta-1,3-galactosyltransferase 5-like isoform X2 [Ciona intestinalis]|eukprot:XP_026694081.1 beta-1,3-galactosyltransferase 5-like isoform X2 [Ciona intestinalis]
MRTAIKGTIFCFGIFSIAMTFLNFRFQKGPHRLPNRMHTDQNSVAERTEYTTVEEITETTTKTTTTTTIPKTTTTTTPKIATTTITDKLLPDETRKYYALEPWKVKLNINVSNNDPDTTWRMVTFVKSTATRHKERELIRRTWASISLVSGTRFETIFVIGEAPSETAKALIKEESERYGDILHFNGPDNYTHICSKTLSGMKWAKENLSPETFYTSSDDDVTVDLAEVIQNIETNIEKASSEKWPEFPILCGYLKGKTDPPHRDKNDKWYIPSSIYKWTVFPQFCFGAYYTTSVSVVSQLYTEALTSKVLGHLDDVWLTGVVRERIGMPDTMVIAPQTFYVKHRPSSFDNEWKKAIAKLRERSKDIQYH